MADNKTKVQLKKETYKMDSQLMERIGWSEEEIASYISFYSTFEENEEREQKRKRIKTKVEKSRGACGGEGSGGDGDGERNHKGGR